MGDLEDFLHSKSFECIETIPRECSNCSSEIHSKTFVKCCPYCGASQVTKITESLIQSMEEIPQLILSDYLNTRLNRWCEHCETGRLAHIDALHSNACWGCSFRYMKDYRHEDCKEPPRGYIEEKIQS